LALRLKFGNITSWDEPEYIPPEERFYSGGEASVRGWKRSQLGPKDQLGDPLGGKSLLEGSCELRFPFADRWSGVAFLDFGNVWIDSMAQKLNDLRYAAGAGVRFRTPVGPLRLDVARPIFDEDNAWVLHFSVGHAF
jgi:outer membrane protein insertion porin family